MNTRLACCCLNRCINIYCKKITPIGCCQRIHEVCTKKEIDFEYNLQQVLFYSNSVPKKCWQCNFPFKSELFCGKCQTLQEPPEQMNYFEILGVENCYDVDVKEIQRKYRQLQNLLHPDKFGNKTDKEKEYSENVSSLLNSAYTTLSRPLDRGLYMLKLRNMSIPEGSTDLDPEFLMEIMEKNEQVEEAMKDGEKIAKLVAENNKILQILTKNISDAFNNNDIEQVRILLVKMKYYANLNDKIKNVKRELGIID